MVRASDCGSEGRRFEPGFSPQQFILLDMTNKSKDLEEEKDKSKKLPEEKKKEIGGPKGPEPTRYGDWERKGIVKDF